jgi:flavin reductase (DIM6/NTAB) family NADH-FMN oxidoreductase RutF
VPEAEDAFRELVSSIEHPMLIVTAATDSERAGCLIGFSTQASMHPPRFLVLISKKNHTMGVAARAPTLVVHFLREDNDDLAALFGEETGDEVDKFARCRWHPGPGGVPVLSGVAGWIAGPVLGRFDMGDHVGHLIDLGEAHVGALGPQLGSQEVRDLDPGHPA